MLQDGSSQIGDRWSHQASAGVVVGMSSEAAIARGLGCPVEIGGGTPSGAEVAAERLVAKGARSLLSFGLAGGLDPAVRAGDIIVPLAVIEGGDACATDPVMSEALGGWFGGLLLAGESIVADISAKRRLFVSSRACAVDLESGAVARVARRHGLPFAVLRAICDPATRALPPGSPGGPRSARGAWHHRHPAGRALAPRDARASQRSHRPCPGREAGAGGASRPRRRHRAPGRPSDAVASPSRSGRAG